MKIKRFTVSNAENPSFEMIPTKPICFVRGRGSEALLDLMRETLGDRLPHSNLNRYHNGHFVLHSDVEIDNEDYRVCYIRNAVDGKNRITVNFGENNLDYSQNNTKKYLQRCAILNKTASNFLIGTANVKDLEDPRPLFIYDYFDRLDEAVDITPILNGLISLGRQIFVAVCSGYNDVNHDNVQMHTIDLVYGDASCQFP